MFPNMQSVQLVRRFFMIFSRWNWDNPVTLCPIRQSNEIGLMSFKVWNPKQYASDRSHLMPIITPAFSRTSPSTIYGISSGHGLTLFIPEVFSNILTINLKRDSTKPLYLR
mmetsp:Transcript_3969/g.3330  ORF Transcript_3969/g.3330 Transcript_3969/m.3330 type:complete len:111 (-) Transcript_3969:43-375(-)